MKRKLFLIISFSLAILLIVACHKDKLVGDKVVTYSYQQTKCADPWRYGSNDTVTMTYMGDYLDSVGMAGPFFGIGMKNDGVQETCLACTCKTGTTFYVTNMDGLTEKYIKLGFKVVVP